MGERRQEIFVINLCKVLVIEESIKLFYAVIGQMVTARL
jgi:hypothetical protein